MDLPQAPADVDLRNIIDKLAQFVARNGPEFEQMTKNKQKGNPKFGFLFGGEHFNYYQYKVTTEQAILKAKAVRDIVQQPPVPGISGSNHQPPNFLSEAMDNLPISMNVPPPPVSQPPMHLLSAAANAAQWLVNQQTQNAANQMSIANLIEQQNTLEQQITQSEQNLAAQQTALIQSQQSQIEDALRKHQLDLLSKLADENNVNLNELDIVLQPIIDSCTKDSISTGKAWILNKNTAKAYKVISEYLLSKVTAPGVIFTQKLHIIYLVNDVMHHCVRKNAEDLKKALENVVVPMFCNASIGAADDQQIKLNKLLNLWEAKNNYFSKEIINQLKTPETGWAEYQADLISNNASVITPVTSATNVAYETYQAQHQVFVNHALQQIQVLEKEKQKLEQQSLESQSHFHNISQAVLERAAHDVMSHPPPSIPSNSLDKTMPDSVNIPLKFDAPPPPLMQTPVPMPLLENLNFSQPPPALFQHLPPDLVPDFSKPPPGFQMKDSLMDDLVPSVPYYELPAGLMVPLIKIDDFVYKPLDPDKIRLPPAMPPSERLLQALESFYQRSSTGRDRLILDADGWEKLGLYEYYKAKNAARKKKEEDLANGVREKSRSPTPIKRERSKSKSPKRKRYQSRSRSRSRERERDRSRSRSPVRHHRSSNGRRSPRRSSGSQRSHRRSRSRSRSVSPVRNRSPTPPSFAGSNYGKTLEQQIDESNKGHQMLKKMGWGGAGLGSKEQGIEAPISGGEVRDRTDQYKGVGVSLHDPYENFRKSKGQAFITRMKARAEERQGAGS